MSNILWSPDPNSPVSAEAFDDDLPRLGDISPLGVFAEAGASLPFSPERGTSSTSSRSALGTSPKARRSRKKAELHNVDTMDTTMPKSTKFVLGLEQSVYVPRKPRVMHGAGRTKKTIVKKLLRPCLCFVVLDCWSLVFISRYSSNTSFLQDGQTLSPSCCSHRSIVLFLHDGGA